MTDDRESAALRCSVPGCAHRWVTSFGRRLCAEHGRMTAPPPAAPRQQAALPLAAEPAGRRWWTDADGDAA